MDEAREEIEELPPDEQEGLRWLDGYVEELNQGRRPDRARLLGRYPHLAALVQCVESLHRLSPAPLFPQDEPTLPPTLNPTVAFAAAGAPALGRFGRYELLGELGRGGMGVVYKARQLDLDRLVAVKMILSSHLASEEHVRRFHAEARAAARLHHANIVQVHEAGEILGQHYFVMEYVPGPSLADHLRRGLPDPKEAARLIAQVARAVDHLHVNQIVHRDLKPANVLLSGPEAVPKITDFGLAKVLEASGDATRTGVVMGTPSYMAPEQAAGKPEGIGPASDVYSLGAILYEMLTGRPPFQESTPLDTVIQVLEGEPVPPRLRNPQAPRDLECICLKCLEKDPAERYASASALAEDLERYLAAEQVEARPRSLGQRVWRWARREPALASHLSGLAVFAVIVQAAYHLSPGGDWSTLPRVQGLLAFWGLASLGCNRLMGRKRWQEAIPYLWAALDVVLLTEVIRLTENHVSPILVSYPLVIAASGLWFRERLVWFTTGVAVAGYLVLAAENLFLVPAPAPPHHQVIFLAALAVMGFVVAHQVRRVRLLSRYYQGEKR